MATTTRGIAYPTASDNIAPLESHFGALASSVDTALAKSVSGTTSTFTLATTVGTATTQTVTFATAFASAPNVTASVNTTTAGAAYTANVYSVSTTGFSVKITRVYGTTNDGNLSVSWNAKVE